MTIPFAMELAKGTSVADSRIRRDFKAVLSLVQAHAVLHQLNREVDDRGRIVATLEDYNAVRDLVHDSIAESTGVKVPKTVRDTVETVEKLRGSLHVPVTYSQLCQAMGLDKGTISKRVSQAIQLGLLVNLETHKWMPAQLVVGDPMREDGEVLPRIQGEPGKNNRKGVWVDCNTATPPWQRTFAQTTSLTKKSTVTRSRP